MNEELIPDEPVHEEVIPKEQVEGSVLCDRAQIKPPSRYRDFAMLVYNEPSTFDDAVHCENTNEWINAMNSVMQSITEKDTWELVEKSDHKNIVSCKWVYRVKTNATGKIDKCKARLVAKVFSQKEGNDYSETF